MFQTPLIHILGSTPSVDPLARQYLQPLLWIAPLFCATYVLNPAMRFQGYPTESMIAMIAGQLVSQHIFSYAVPISTFITIGGGIYFLYLLLSKKGGM